MCVVVWVACVLCVWVDGGLQMWVACASGVCGWHVLPLVACGAVAALVRREACCECLWGEAAGAGATQQPSKYVAHLGWGP